MASKVVGTQLIPWNILHGIKMLADTDYLEELVNNKLMILFLHPLGWLPCSCGGVRATGRFLPSGLKYDKFFRENAKQDVECKWSILGGRGNELLVAQNNVGEQMAITCSMLTRTWLYPDGGKSSIAERRFQDPDNENFVG